MFTRTVIAAVLAAAGIAERVCGKGFKGVQDGHRGYEGWTKDPSGAVTARGGRNAWGNCRG